MPDQPTELTNIANIDTPNESFPPEPERQGNPASPPPDEDVSKWVDIGDPSTAPESGAY